MDRSIEAVTTLRAPVSRIEEVVRDDPGRVLVDAVSTDDRAARTFATVIGPRSGEGTVVQQEVLVEFGVVGARDGVFVVPFSWRPSGHERLLPTFDGQLSAVGDGCGRTRLTLEGNYHLPLGIVGRFGDSIAGRRLARQTVSALLEEIAVRIDREVDGRGSVAHGPLPPRYPVDLREGPRSEYHIG